MFPDKDKTLTNYVNTWVANDGDFGSISGGSYKDYGGIEDLSKLISSFTGYATEKKSPPKDTLPSPIRLAKNRDCPVCGHQARQASKYLGEGGADEYKNVCDKCGFSDLSLTGDSEFVLSLEEFQWTFYWNDTKEERERNIAEQKRVVELYRKFWSATPLASTEEAELDGLASVHEVIER